MSKAGMGESDRSESDGKGSDERGPDGSESEPSAAAAGRKRARKAPSLLQRYRIPIGLVLLVVLLRPVVANDLLLGYEAVATRMLIMMLFVAAFNLLFGFTGLLSFGHAMFLGFGMYITAIAVVHGLPGLPAGGSLTFVAGAILSLLAVAVFSYLLGKLIVQKGEIYFAMLTLAVSQAIYFVVLRDPGGLTGGSNGLTGGALPNFVEQVRGKISVQAVGLSVDWYWVVAVVVLLALLAMWQVLRSPFGRTLVAIRENEQLARAMGVDTARYKVWSLTFSGTFAALAGVLLEIHNSGAAIEDLSVITSGDTVLMAVLGGIQYFFGPIAGTFTWLFAEDFLTDFEVLHVPTADLAVVSVDLSTILGYWQFFLGALFVVVVLTSPQDGIWGYIRAIPGRIRGRVEGWRS
ncbi:MAG: branched-chain amino acid ABC transporter permease [Haloarculaceae archaeon]